MSVLRWCVVIVLVTATSSDAAPVLQDDVPGAVTPDHAADNVQDAPNPGLRPSIVEPARAALLIAAHVQPARDEMARRSPASSDRPLVPVLFLLGAMCIGAILYFLPSMVATARGHENKLAIFVLNLLLGWTLLGWVGALVWSLTVPRRTHAGGGAG